MAKKSTFATIQDARFKASTLKPRGKPRNPTGFGMVTRGASTGEEGTGKNKRWVTVFEFNRREVARASYRTYREAMRAHEDYMQDGTLPKEAH